jgi:S1-C subfamily serine protease
VRWRQAAATFLIAATIGVGEPAGWLGFGFTYHTQRNEKHEVTSGWMIVRNVAPGGPAARAGLVPGDVVVSIDGKQLLYIRDLDVLLLLGTFSPGRRVKVALMHGAERRTITIVPVVMTEAQRGAWRANLDIAQHRAARH